MTENFLIKVDPFVPCVIANLFYIFHPRKSFSELIFCFRTFATVGRMSIIFHFFPEQWVWNIFELEKSGFQNSMVSYRVFLSSVRLTVFLPGSIFCPLRTLSKGRTCGAYGLIEFHGLSCEQCFLCWTV